MQAFALEAIPRISRAQVMDALSSQANVVRLQGRAAGGVGVDPVLPDADDGGGHREAGHGAGARRRRGRAAGAGDGQTAGRRAPPATTCVPRWPTRCVRWGRSGWTSASTRPARAGTPAS